jgi:two-component system NtrC family sensor kinase
VLPRIFDPFFTTKPEGKGTGLGLSICHGIIAEHAGNLWAENNTDGGGGATFFVQLPVISATAPGGAPVNEPPQTATISPQNLHIMIIDDETSVLSVLTRTLKRVGYRVDAAGNGISALAYLEKTRYDLILCDMRMPDLNGTELYWKVMEKDPEMAKRIIFTTGDVVSPSTRQFFEETGAAYLAKPFELKQLVEYVHHILMKWAKHDSS